MNVITARTKPFIAIAGGSAALLTIVNLAPAGEARSRYRTLAPAADQTRIEIDRSADAIRFYVEGKEVVFIDAKGINH